MIFLGFDPGGKNRNGVALLRVGDNGPSVVSDDVESAQKALDWFSDQCGPDDPVALGIDTLLHWSLSKSGWRPVDGLLRSKYPEQANSVLAMNSIYGSMVGQGMALAIAANKRWPNLRFNEVHPKVLYCELINSDYQRGISHSASVIRSECLERLGVENVKVDLHSEDQFDAILCCFATFRGHCYDSDWADLIESSNKEGLIFPISGVTYFWPRQL